MHIFVFDHSVFHGLWPASPCHGGIMADLPMPWWNCDWLSHAVVKLLLIYPCPDGILYDLPVPWWNCDWLTLPWWACVLCWWLWCLYLYMIMHWITWAMEGFVIHIRVSYCVCHLRCSLVYPPITSKTHTRKQIKLTKNRKYYCDKIRFRILNSILSFFSLRLVNKASHVLLVT